MARTKYKVGDLVKVEDGKVVEIEAIVQRSTGNNYMDTSGQEHIEETITASYRRVKTRVKPETKKRTKKKVDNEQTLQ